MAYTKEQLLESIRLKNSIQVEGYCGMVIFENDYTLSTTEEGDMQSVNHRGLSNESPENTLAAYAKSKEKGFRARRAI